jgi:putative nucleotidyltransferase with HDIG domain
MVEPKVSKAELIASLSHALDLVEGQPRGHAVRTAHIAVRLAREAHPDPGFIGDVHYAALLKDAGCSNNSARIHKIFGGDETQVKREVKLVDWSDPVQAVIAGIRFTERGGSLAAKLRRMARNIAPPQKVMAEATAARCYRGAAIASRLGFSRTVSSAIEELDEHWDGRGAPVGKRGEEISLGARVVGLAQTLEVFVSTYGVEAGYEMLDQRKGRWFDPGLVAAAQAFRRDPGFWEVHVRSFMGAPIRIETGSDEGAAGETEIDAVCEAFASIIDAKSTYTGEHSSRVTEYAVAVASALGVGGESLQTLRRAALLHDIGKLGVPNSILDKPGKLDGGEFEKIKAHPKFTWEILRPIRGFSRLAEIAAAHHERPDGRGYWRGLAGPELDTEMRCLTAADVFDALSAARPYRDALPPETVLSIMAQDAGSGIDPDCLAVLQESGERLLSEAA